MTCIVGYVDKKNKKVVMGADSAGVGGLDITIRKDKKIFKVGDFVIGCTTSFRMIQILQFSFNPPKVYDKDLYEYMCTDFINSVKECFKNGGYLQKYSNGDEKGGTFLVGYKDRLFSIQDDFQVQESIDGFDSCGCGFKYALASMYTNKKSNAKKIVIKALETAEYYSGGVCSPFHLYCT